MAVTARIKSWAIRRKMSDASWLWDLVNLQRTIALCKGCATQKMPWRWEQKLHYQEMSRFHGSGHCDFCRSEDTVSLYQSTETPQFAAMERDHHLVAATQERARVAVSDRRRVR
jgi:hypothetical protein